MSNSSYSWWGAWLARSFRVIYPVPFVGPKLRYTDWSLMFPPDWIAFRYAF